MTTATLRGHVPCQRASLLGSSRAPANGKQDTEMRIRPIALAGALVLAAPAPAVAHRRDAHNPQPELARQIIAHYFPAHARARAFRIVGCESTYDPRALNHNRNGTHDRGWWMLNDGGTMQSLGLTAEEAFDPWASTEAAYRLWRRRGWSPWVCSGRRT